METDANGKPVSKTFFSVDSMIGDAVNSSVKLEIEAVTIDNPADTLKSFRPRPAQFWHKL